MGNRHLLHVRSNQVTNNEPKLPQSSDIRYGELAINYAKGNETISLKNSNDEIVSFNIGKSIKGVKVNNVNATIANNIASVTISGSDENVGTYTSVQYPNEFSGATPVSGTQTIAQAFNSVETTVSALTQELIKDELVFEKINKSIAEAAGTIDSNNEIKYNVNENAHYISAATSLANADDILDSKVKDIETSVTSINYAESQTNPGGPAKMAVSIPFGQVDSTSTSTAFTATVSGITELRNGVYCYLRNGVVNSTSGYTLDINNLGAKPVYSSLSNARTTTVFTSASTFMFVYNETRVEGGCWDMYYGYQYDSNTNTIGYYISPYYGTKKAKNIIYRYMILLTYDDEYLLPINTTSNTTAGTKTLTTESFNPFDDVYYYSVTASTAADAVMASGRTWSQYPLNLSYSFNTTNTLVSGKNVYMKCVPQSDGKVKLYAEGNPIVQALPTTEDGFVYKKLGFAYNTTSIVLTQDKPCYYFKDGQIRLWTNQTETDISGKADINHTHVSSAVTIEEDYQEISYPQSFSGATNVESGQTVTEAFQNVETTISALTQELINDELINAKAITALGSAAGTIDENSTIKYEPNENATYISAATNLYEADSLLDAAISNIASSSQNSISGVSVNGVDATITNKVANVVISGNNINVGTYTEVEYPQDLSGATPVSGTQTIAQAFNSVETTISALTQEVLDDELVTENAIKALGNAAGTIDSNDNIKYVAPSSAKYISAATSVYDATVLLDTALQNNSGSISSITLNGTAATITNKVAALTASGSSINIGSYTSVTYPASLTGASNVSGSQSVAQAFNSVETTISAVTTAMDNKADKVKVINHGTTGTTFTLPPNEMHVWGSVSALTLSLATPTDNTIVNEYLFSFTSPLSATTLSLPASVKWVFELVVEPEKTYTISIVDNLATYLTEDMSIIGADESVLAQKEDISNKVTTIDQNSSDIQYPSAKCVYDYIEARLLQLNS